ncbi:hypothetical protein ONZ45_g2211 [Pleurotus djamor]|nr:hypothetical protein ONZ45_g2211 [Pleurotus djamor]
MTTSTDVETLKAIDGTIARTQGLTFSAIPDLPDDVLALVFLAYKAKAMDDGAWLNIVSICQRWRAILLSTPRFWSSITAYDLPFVDTMIERAKSLPLTLQLAVPLMESDEARAGFNTILDHSSRIEGITFSLLESDRQYSILYGLMTQIETHDFSLLRVLRIAAADLDALSFSLSASIWSRRSRFNAFHSLELHNVIFRLQKKKLPYLPSLRNLVVLYDYSHNGVGLSLQWITKFLRRTPNLETLELDVIDSNGHPNVDCTTPIALPALRHARMGLAGIDESPLFDYLDIPTSAVVRVHFPDQTLTGRTFNYSNLENLLQKRIRPASTKQIVLKFKEATWEIQFYTAAIELPTFFLSLPFLPPMVQEYASLFLALPMSHIPELGIYTIDTTPPLTWSLLTANPYLIRNAASSSSLRYIDLNGPILPPPDSLYLPSLTKLAVTGSPSISWIARFLLNTPNVEEMWLTLISPDDPGVSGIPFVSLPKLAYCEIASASVTESKLLNYLDFPTSAKLYIEHPNEHNGEFIDLSPFEKRLTRLLAEETPIGDVALTVDDVNGQFTLNLKRPNSEETLMILALPLVTTSADAYLSLFSKLPLPAIEKLRICRISSPAAALLWSSIIPLFLNLTQLTLDNTIHDVLDVLLSPNATPNSPHCNVKLKTIVDINPSWDDRAVADVIRIFKGRREMRLPIDKYIVKGSGVGRDIVAELREFVNVELDGELSMK